MQYLRLYQIIESLYQILYILLISSQIANSSNSDVITIFGTLHKDLNISCPLEEKRYLTWSIEISDQNPDRKIITPNHKYTFHRCKNCSSKIANILRINSLTDDDEGFYACYSTSQQSKKFKLQLIVPITGVSMTSVVQNNDDNTIYGVVNQPLVVTCSVTKSRPSAHISVNIERDKRKAGETRFEPLPEFYKTILQADQSFSSQQRFVANRLRKEDDLSKVTCVASLFGPSKTHDTVKVSKTLRVHYPPECNNLNEPIFIALNRSNFITCPIEGSNPSVISYSWKINNLEHGGSLNDRIVEVIPRSINEMDSIVCYASNGIGSDARCKVDIVLGGKPDPVTDCHWSFPTNNSLQIVCKLGFHQGDRNQQCVLYRQDNENGLMSEYARSQKCSFLVDSTNYNEPHRFRVFSLNKFGDSLQNAVAIEINTRPAINSASNSTKKLIRFSVTVFIIVTIIILLLLCCWYICSCENTGRGKQCKQTANSKKWKNEKPRQSRSAGKTHRCYSRRAQSDTGDANNLLMPLVPNGSGFCSSPDENSCSIVDSSATSSYLVPRGNSPALFVLDSLPQSPPPVTPRSKGSNVYINNWSSKSTSSLNERPRPSPRKFNRGNYEIKFAKSVQGIGSTKVTNC